MKPQDSFNPSIRLIPGAVSDLFAQVSRSQSLSLADRYGLMAAILDDSLTDDERNSIDRLLHSTKRGRTKLVDDLSSIMDDS